MSSGPPSSGLIIPIHIWHNLIVLQRSRPSELAPLLGLLYGWPDAKERWEQHLKDMERWQQRRRELLQQQSDFLARIDRPEELPPRDNPN